MSTWKKTKVYTGNWSPLKGQLPRLLPLGLSADWLFPGRCCQCGCQTASELICSPCREELPDIGVACPVCGIPAASATPCGICLRSPPAFHQTVAPYRFCPPVSGLITALKYGQRLSAAQLLAQAMADRAIALNVGLPDAFIPVPLHTNRLRRRGFNQSIELATHLARLCKRPLLRDATVRTRATPSQTGMSARQRRTNLRRAFSIQPTGYPSENLSHLAIVDDVMTTGSTANELARTLLDGGASQIDVWVAARVEKPVN